MSVVAFSEQLDNTHLNETPYWYFLICLKVINVYMCLCKYNDIVHVKYYLSCYSASIFMQGLHDLQYQLLY